MNKGCYMLDFLNTISPIFSALAAIASVFAVYKANEIAKTVRDFQKNSVLNSREIELIGKALEKLSIYDTWCKPNCSGEDVNYHQSNEVEYTTRDDATLQIPRDVKFILIQLSSHSEILEKLLIEWENGFIAKTGNDYAFIDELVSEKIQSLRSIRAGGL